MEKLVLRKFTIQKETISNLSDGAQRRILGGYGGYGEVPTFIIKIWCDEILSLGKDTQCDQNPECMGPNTRDTGDCDSHTYVVTRCPSDNNMSCYCQY